MDVHPSVLAWGRLGGEEPVTLAAVESPSVLMLGCRPLAEAAAVQQMQEGRYQNRGRIKREPDNVHHGKGHMTHMLSSGRVGQNPCVP
jgi:hypothetical protein